MRKMSEREVLERKMKSEKDGAKDDLERIERERGGERKKSFEDEER